MKTKRILSVLCLTALACVPASLSAQTANFDVVPAPRTVKTASGAPFVINEKTSIVYKKGDKAQQRAAQALAGYIERALHLRLAVTTKAAQYSITLSTAGKKDAASEGYTINVSQDGIRIEGASDAGLFYGVQTLRKALPVLQSAAKGVEVPAGEVADAPRFAYRGAHLDVSRHFVTLDSVKRFIDMLALHNINRFHWHLTDDQGWRIEIKKYPKLTTVGAYRPETVIGHNTGKYDGKPHQGFYTQKEAREIVEYARERFITVIPEIDLPGHMQAALAAYPELGCTGGPYEVWKMWGVSDNVLCAGKDNVLKFIDDVLTEITKIFPSEYIHVGGDECPKTQWAKCPACQKRIADNNLQADGKHTAEERLQSYVINHAEKTLNALGRQMIGWDETLEGGLAPNATVMSWRGEAGGIEAARQHHPVIMTPNTYLYFDYYQTKDVANEPEAIGGYLPLERVYGYEPMPRELSPEELKYIIGVQANLWSEYMPTYRQMEYMELPRMAALAEIQWAQPEKKDYKKFLKRLVRLIDHYDALGYNYARHIYEVNPKYIVDDVRHVIRAEMTTMDNAEIRYTLDGTEPTQQSPLYKGAVEISKDCTFKAAAYRPNSGRTRTQQESFTFTKATACPIRLLQPINGGYKFDGPVVLVDGLTGPDTNYRTGRWLGFSQADLEAIVDLGSAQTFSQAGVHTCVEKGDWVFDARGVEISISDDGENFRPVASEYYPEMKETDANKVYSHVLSFAPVTARFVKVKALSEHCMPAWHGSAGKAGFLFVDEIIVK
ncbi:MAG: family 20 glycosylhydrolase [Bacteroidales bacterium]